MACLRQGKITFPHKPNAAVQFHKVDGFPAVFHLTDIDRWAEYRLHGSISDVVLIHHGMSSTAVRETFDEVSDVINSRRVQP